MFVTVCKVTVFRWLVCWKFTFSTRGWQPSNFECSFFARPGFRLRLGASDCSPRLAFRFIGPWTFSWMWCPQLYHQCKNIRYFETPVTMSRKILHIYFSGDTVYFWGDNVYFWGTKIYFWRFSKILGFFFCFCVAWAVRDSVGRGVRGGLLKYLTKAGHTAHVLQHRGHAEQKQGKGKRIPVPVPPFFWKGHAMEEKMAGTNEFAFLSL